MALPALICRLTGTELAPGLALVVFGAGVVAAAFVLAWAAEAAQLDVSGGLAIAALALVAVLPEYAVDLYYAFVAGSDPAYLGYTAANMTGSNRLLLGLGWSSVTLITLLMLRRRSAAARRHHGRAIGRGIDKRIGRGIGGGTGAGSGRDRRVLTLPAELRRDLGLLAIAAAAGLLMPLTGRICLVFGLALIGLFGYHLYRVSARPDDDQADGHQANGHQANSHQANGGQADDALAELVGPAQRIGALPRSRRRPLVLTLFIGAALVLLASAEPFAQSLVDGGKALGIDEFLLIQWLAPLASESPELIVVILFALRGRGAAAIGVLISAQLNQWTLLVGSLPVAYVIGGGFDGPAALVLDGRQSAELFLTATLTLLGVALLLELRLSQRTAWLLLGLFALTFAVPGQDGRDMLAVGYAGLALLALIRHRGHLLPTLTAPFRRERVDDDASRPQLVGTGRR